MRPGLLLVFAATVASSQQAQQKGSIEGQVVNAITGEPLRKAQVMLRSADSRRASTYGASTDAGGNFTVPELEKGTYRLSVERAGFVRAEYGGRRSRRGAPAGAAISLDSGQKISGLVMKLTPQAVITGRILDSDGDPVVHASVNAFKYAYLRGQRQLMPAGGASTDDQGEYRIHSLQPGKYYVSATWQPAGNAGPWRGGPGEMQGPSEDAYAPTYYPRVVDVAAAVALDAAPGAVLRNIDILLTKVRTVSVSGKIVDPNGPAGGRNLMVMAIPRAGATGMMGGRGAQIQDGKFLIRGLRAGGYTLTAERWENNKRITARVPVEVGDSPLEGIALVLSPGLTLDGTVRMEGTQQNDVPGVSVLLNARGDSTFSSTSGGRTQKDGTFTISNAAPDTYGVTVMGMPDNCYLKSIRFGDEDALANGLNLSRGAGASLDIVLSPAAGSVEAVVLDAKQQPATGVYVVAVPEGARADSQQFYKSAITDPYGRASLKGLAPGDYKLYAWEDVEPNAWQDPDFRKQYEKSGESISIRENGRESKQLTVIPGGDGAKP
jgi:protocatechuate 3,4-dioxygenase beta subunit